MAKLAVEVIFRAIVGVSDIGQTFSAGFPEEDFARAHQGRIPPLAAKQALLL